MRWTLHRFALAARSAAGIATAQGRQTGGATTDELPLSLMRGTALEKPPSCLPSLAADC